MTRFERPGRRAVLMAPALLAACAAESVVAPPGEVSRAVYRHSGPPALTLFTMISTRSEAGAHSGLMVNGSQRVIFDPAGTFNHPQLPEVNDVFFGITPAAFDFYVDYHARETYRVAVHEIDVSAEQAEIALQGVRRAGPVAPARCNIAISDVVGRVPGFEDCPRAWFPRATMEYFRARPGVRAALYEDDSPDSRGDLIEVPLVR
ncbi:MAG: hypothetical protein AAFR47_05540 [Pseudomonadota bacterium]